MVIYESCIYTEYTKSILQEISIYVFIIYKITTEKIITCRHEIFHNKNIGYKVILRILQKQSSVFLYVPG